MDFEFVETLESAHFLKRNPEFADLFERVMALGNACFGRQIRAKNRVEDLSFWLGHACRQDFVELIFLAINGYSSGAWKILRGLYERAVALAWIVKTPEKAERFVRFGAIQEHRMLQAALNLVSEEDFDKAMGENNSAADIRERYRQMKSEFQVTVCEKCGAKRTQPGWDLDVAAMAKKVGDPYDRFYLTAYVIPNSHVHATLASTFNQQEVTKTPDERRREADFAVLHAMLLLIQVIRSQNELFSLGLKDEIDGCEQKIVEAWNSLHPNRD